MKSKVNYSFGAAMPGRSFVGATGYRYGFNGKENDNEVKGNGNSYDYDARIYDPRLGRALSLDPLKAKFPSLSPYQFFSNNPILFVDLDGQEGVQYLQRTEHKDGTSIIHRVVELDLYVGITNQEGNAHYKANDIANIQEDLDKDFNTGTFKDADGNKIIFKFNVKVFDADKLSAEAKSNQLKNDPSNYEASKGNFVSDDKKDDGYSKRGLVVIRNEPPKSNAADVEGGTTNTATQITQIHKNSDNSHTRTHEISHFLLSLDPKNPGSDPKFNITQHNRYGGIFKLREQIKETGKEKEGGGLENLNKENVDKILQYVPTKSDVIKKD